jgi:hypothetical protein
MRHTGEVAAGPRKARDVLEGIAAHAVNPQGRERTGQLVRSISSSRQMIGRADRTLQPISGVKFTFPVRVP